MIIVINIILYYNDFNYKLIIIIIIKRKYLLIENLSDIQEKKIDINCV